MFACTVGIRNVAGWLLALPVPDPDLQFELMGWAIGLLWLAEGIEGRFNG
jgi:hypothetical protein